MTRGRPERPVQLQPRKENEQVRLAKWVADNHARLWGPNSGHSTSRTGDGTAVCKQGVVHPDWHFRLPVWL